ncbi:heme-binding protein 2 [Scophthalmus maximus]|uniref:heme-binding protein 2 n=1 Tax=Scophthalmus maximus TaxID=52904 RepID=UPI001FA85861|nr:heme-binding protein 2 [Scophthalmus maximus]
MMYLSGLVGLLLVLTVDARVGNSSFCTETEQCLLFDCICTTEDYEVHDFGSVKWVTTNETSLDTLNIGFKRLYDYFSGSNDNGTIFQMAFPIILRIPFNISAMDVFTLSFLLPDEYQIETPNPLDIMVNIDTTPDMRVFVRSFFGPMTGMADSNLTNSLSNVLDLVGARYLGEFYYAALYNSSMEMTDSYSEMWFVADYEPSSSSGSSGSSGSSSSSSEETVNSSGC